MLGYAQLKKLFLLALIGGSFMGCTPSADLTGDQAGDIEILPAEIGEEIISLNPDLGRNLEAVKIGDEWIDLLDTERRAAAELEARIHDNRSVFGSLGNLQDDVDNQGVFFADISSHQATVDLNLAFEAPSNVDVDGTMGGEDSVRGGVEAEPEVPAGTHIDAIKVCFRTNEIGQRFNPVQTPITMTFCPTGEGAFEVGDERGQCFSYGAINTDRVSDGYFCSWRPVLQREQPIVYPHHFKYFAIENEVDAPAPSYTNSWLISGIDIQVRRFGDAEFTSIYTAPAFNKLLDSNTPVAYGSFQDTGIIANIGIGYQGGAGTNQRLDLACEAGPEAAGLVSGSVNSVGNHRVPHLRREHDEIIMNLNYLNDRDGREGRFDDLEAGHLTTYGAMWFDGDPLRSTIINERRPQDPHGNRFDLDRAQDVYYKRCRFKFAGGQDSVALRDAAFVIYRPWRPLGEDRRTCHLRQQSIEWVSPAPTSRDCRMRGRDGCMSYPAYVNHLQYLDAVSWISGSCDALQHIDPERAASPKSMLNYFDFTEDPTMCLIRDPNAHADNGFAGGRPNRDDCNRF